MTASRRFLIACCAAIPWILLLGQLLVVVPRYRRLFEQYSLQLPFLTRLSIQASSLLKSQPLLSLGIVFGLMVLWWTLADAVCRRETIPLRRHVALLILFAIPVGIFAICWLSILIPERKLQEALLQ